MPAKSSTALNRIPDELWSQIFQALPTKSLASLVLCSSNLYKIGNPHLYHTVYYLGTRRSDEHRAILQNSSSNFGVHQAQSWLFDPAESSRIIHPEAFLKTITLNSELLAHITGASFGWDDTADPQGILVAKMCLGQLTSSPDVDFLHLALPEFDPTFAIANKLTFLEIEYPDQMLLNNDYIDSRYDVALHSGLRDILHSIFCIPTLQHLSLKGARTWQAFTPLSPADTSRVGTSNVTALSLPRTVPLSRDLKEILTWPKALRSIFHENTQGRGSFFQNYRSEQIASPEVFIEGLHGQRATLEDLIYNNGEDGTGNDETTFGTALREFIRLKHLAVPKECLVESWIDGDEEPQSWYAILPPSLEEAWIELDNADVYPLHDFERRLRGVFEQGLRGVAMNKVHCCPTLRRLVLHIWEPAVESGIEPDGYEAEARRILDEL